MMLNSEIARIKGVRGEKILFWKGGGAKISIIWIIFTPEVKFEEDPKTALNIDNNNLPS